jgi:hypothetical protein
MSAHVRARRTAPPLSTARQPVKPALYPDSTKIEIPCKCGRNTQKTIGWIKANNEFVCGCGNHIDLRTAAFRRQSMNPALPPAGAKRSIKR